VNPLDLLAHFAPSQIATREINRLLAEQPAARERLQRFASKSARFALSPIAFTFRVRSNGEVETFNPANEIDGAKPDVSIIGTLDALSAVLRAGDAASSADRMQRAMQYVTIEGNVGFAQEIAFLAEHLRIEPEERVAQGLRRLLPMFPTHAIDAAAVNGVQGAKTFLRWSVDAGDRLMRASAEYLVHESATLVSRDEFNRFTDDVQALNNRIERTIKRAAQQS
jgi:ubiquinone biosynthesis accessory factor UbiJ